MASEQYWEGRLLESNITLHNELITALKFDKVEVDGGSDTKGDIIGITGNDRVHVSVKYASGGNTQVHLPTLNSLAKSLNMPTLIKDKLDMFLGTTDLAQFQTWSQGIAVTAEEVKYKRLLSKHIADWHLVEQWFNDNKRTIAVLLLQSLDNKDLAPWLVWANKKKGGLQVVDVNMLVDWIVKECTWVTMPKGTVMRCALPSLKEGKIGKPIFFMQMKNSGGTHGEYNHSPQFHLNKNWPKEFIVHENPSIQF